MTTPEELRAKAAMWGEGAPYQGTVAYMLRAAADTIATLTARLATSQAHAKALAEALDPLAKQIGRVPGGAEASWRAAGVRFTASQIRAASAALTAYRAPRGTTPAATQEQDR